MLNLNKCITAKPKPKQTFIFKNCSYTHCAQLSYTTQHRTVRIIFFSFTRNRTVFCRLDALSVIQPTVSKHWRDSQCRISIQCIKDRQIYKQMAEQSGKHTWYWVGKTVWISGNERVLDMSSADTVRTYKSPKQHSKLQRVSNRCYVSMSTKRCSWNDYWFVTECYQCYNNTNRNKIWTMSIVNGLSGKRNASHQNSKQKLFIQASILQWNADKTTEHCGKLSPSSTRVLWWNAGSRTTSSYVTRSSWSNNALCLARYLSW